MPINNAVPSRERDDGPMPRELRGSSGGRGVHTGELVPKLPSGDDTLLRLTQIIGPGGYLPVSRSTFYKLVSAGVLKKVSVPGLRVALWRKSDLLALVKGCQSAEVYTATDGEVHHG